MDVLDILVNKLHSEEVQIPIYLPLHFIYFFLILTLYEFTGQLVDLYGEVILDKVGQVKKDKSVLKMIPACTFKECMGIDFCTHPNQEPLTSTVG